MRGKPISGYWLRMGAIEVILNNEAEGANLEHPCLLTAARPH